MLTFGIYMVGSERQGRRHEPVTTLFWAFAFASLFWALVTPWWSFPFDGLASTRNALLATAMVVGGTLVPFILMVAALRHIAAPRAAVVATLEPVLAAVFAWLIHDEALAAVQIAGGWRCSRRWPGCSRGGPITRPRLPPKAHWQRDFLLVKQGRRRRAGLS